MNAVTQTGVPQSPDNSSYRRDKMLVESYRPTSSTFTNSDYNIFSSRMGNRFGAMLGMSDGLDSPNKTKILHSLPDERKSRPITGNSPRILNNLAQGKIIMDPKLVSEQTNAYDFLQQKIYSPFFLAYNEKGKIFKESLTKNLENCLNSKKIKTTSNASKMLLNITSPKAIGTLGSSPRIILQNSGSNTSLKVIKSSIVSKHQEPNIEMSPLSSKLILSPRSIKSSNSPIDLGNNTHKRRIVNENQIIEKFLKKRGSKSNFPVVELPTLNTRKIIKK